ncbi:MAG: hypothetical protein LDL07_08730 [Desulfarculus sp.]|nr:hypothetical protein [Desulfarculus sp.]
MEDKRNLHLKAQELADCYATSDPLPEMSGIAALEDKQEAALKWLALAVLHAVNANAKKISLELTPDGQAVVTAKYREAILPTPGPEVGALIMDAARELIHAEDAAKAKLPLAFGVRGDSLTIQVKVERDKKGGQELSLKFADED